MSVALQVPFIRQESSATCWHAAARMLAAHRLMSVGPLPEQFDRGQTLMPSGFVDLARAAGLYTMPTVSRNYSGPFFDNALRTYGPLWAAGYWNGSPHVIVVTGTNDGGALIVNDPALFGPEPRASLWFNSRVAAEAPAPMMFLPRW